MRKMMWIVAALAATGVLTLGAAACGGGGGGGEQMTAEEYSAALNSICEDFNAKQEEIGEPQSLEDVIEIGPQVVEVFDEAIGAVQELEPPDELADTADEFVSLGEQQRDVLSELVEAAESGDTAKVNELAEEGGGLDDQSDELATELDAPACTE